MRASRVPNASHHLLVVRGVALTDTRETMESERKPSRAELGEIAFVGRGGRTPRVLAHGGYGDRTLALDDRYLYWSDDRAGEITRLPKDGGIPMVLAQRTYPKHLTLSEGFLYWREHMPDAKSRRDGGPPHQVVRMPKDGGEVEVLASDIDSINAVVVRGEELIILCDGVFDYDRREEVHGAVLYLAPGAKKPVALATKQRRPESAVFVGDEVYWLNGGWKWPTYFHDGAVLHTKLAGTKKRWVVRKDLPMAGSLIRDETHIYWTTTPTYHKPLSDGGVFKRPIGGGAIEPLQYLYERDGALLAQDDANLYCLMSEDGSLLRIPKNGDECEVMMTCVERLTLPKSLVVDERRVYWCVGGAERAGGAVWSIAKEPAGTRRDEPESDEPSN